MIDFTPLTPRFATSAQLTPGDVSGAKAAGFAAIVNARPDGEEPGQPPSRAIAEAARSHGLAYFHIPVFPGEIGDDAVMAFAEALRAADGPVLGYCRSGRRAAALFERAATLG